MKNKVIDAIPRDGKIQQCRSIQTRHVAWIEMYKKSINQTINQFE